MKKMLSVILALVMILSLSTVAFADDGDTWDGNYTATEQRTFNEIVKTYTSENNVVVNETLSFTSAAKSTNPDGGTANLTVADLVVSSLNPGTLAVTIPSLSVAGNYEWTITEVAGNSAGVTYSEDEVHVLVVVGYDNDNGAHALKILNTTSYIKKKENGDKAKTFTNTFKSGSFTVAKEVTGNMANENDEFEITVKLTSDKPVNTDVSLAGTVIEHGKWTAEGNEWTTTSTLKYSKRGGAKTFSDIPEGVKVSVVENNVGEGKLTTNGYKYVSTNDNTENAFSMTVADGDVNKPVVVTNDKTTEVATGVALDSLPYVLLLAVACVGMAVVLTKKRRED